MPSNGRLKQKDAYDVYYCIRNYPGGIEALAAACQPLLAHDNAVNGYTFINAKFEMLESLGPTNVRKFVEDSQILGDRFQTSGSGTHLARLMPG